MKQRTASVFFSLIHRLPPKDPNIRAVTMHHSEKSVLFIPSLLLRGGRCRFAAGFSARNCRSPEVMVQAPEERHVCRSARPERKLRRSGMAPQVQDAAPPEL